MIAGCKAPSRTVRIVVVCASACLWRRRQLALDVEGGFTWSLRPCQLLRKREIGKRQCGPKKKTNKAGAFRCQNETFEIFKKSVKEARVIGVLAVVFGIYVGFARDEATANFKMAITR
jgi:hypothetical protein